MSSHARIIALVERAVSEVNQHRPENEKISVSKEDPLVGENGILDSLSLISLLVVMEDEIEKDFRLSISLTEDERILSGENSPVRTIDTLVDYLSHRLKV